jgi:superfamily II DNA or RNA helicase
MLTYLGYRIPSKTDAELASLKRELTVSPKDTLGKGFPMPKYSFWAENADHTALYVPKHFGLQKLGPPIRPSFYKPTAYVPTNPRAWEFNGSLRPGQEEPVQAYLKSASEGRDGILQLPTGYGKTTITLYLLSQMVPTVVKGPALIIVSEEDLGEQWVERIKQFLPHAKVGWVQRDRCDVDCDISIAMLQSLNARDYGKDKLGQFRMIVVDECHIIGSEVYTQCLMGLSAPFMLGLSATPRRKDGLECVMKWFLGDVVFRIERPPDADVRVQVHTYECDDPGYTTLHTDREGRLVPAKMLNQTAFWKPRNEYIVGIVMELLKEPQRQVLVISDRREGQLEVLEGMLKEAGCDSVGMYVGRKGSSKKVHRERIEEAMTQRVILGTYMKAKQGLDIRTLNAIVLATPQPDVEQATGRILREMVHERRVSPVIADIVDVQLPNYKRQWGERKRYYKQRGYTLQDMKDTKN